MNKVTLQRVGELAMIRRLAAILPAASPGVLAGPGDDCAVVSPYGCSGIHWLLKSDPVIEGVHFTSASSPGLVGRKAIARVLSDLAAMGGEPDWALINVVAPPQTEASRLSRLYRGAVRLADRYGLAIVGGDLSQGPALELHVFAVGHIPAGQAVLRSGARAGDVLFVTGALGGSIRGRHLRFEPRVAEGMWLRENGWPSAMIDVSDGVAADLRHLMRMSRVGAEIELARLPVSAAARRMEDGRSPSDHALRDGEDFELLFSVPRRKADAFVSAWEDTFDLQCTRIGSLTSRRGVLAIRDASGAASVLRAGGYEHFSRP